MTDHHDILAAFVDNEAVGAENLAAALAVPAGRDYLIDLLVLRGIVGGATNARPAATFAGSSRRTGFWLTAAAACLAVGVAGGFFAGRGTFGEPHATGARVANVVAAPSTTMTAPAPTHVIRMERGVDWNERSGGN